VPIDPSEWARFRALPRIVVHPKSPLPNEIDDWIVPGKASDDGPDDWIAPGNARADTFPNDWFVPPPTATPSTGQFPPDAQPSTANSARAYPAVTPDPFAAYWSQIPASRIGALAWAPPYLPPFSPSFSTNNFPASTPPSAPPILPGSRPSTLGVDTSASSSTYSPPSPVIPQGGLLGALATLGTSLSPGQGGLLGQLATLGMPPPLIPSEGGLLGGLAKLGTPSPAPPSSLAGGSFPGPGRPASSPMPGTLQAFWDGLGAGTRQVAQTVQSVSGAPTIAAQESPAAEPLGWSGLASPSGIAPKIAYQFAQSYPTLAGGVAGGLVGGRLGALAGPEGAAAGAIVGGSLGAAALSAAQTLGPVYAAELQRNPSDPEGAWNRAWRQAEISGAFSGASWAVFPARFFQGPVKHLVFQIFVAQPAVAVAEKTTRNIVEGKPATEGLGEAYGQGVVGTAIPALGHGVVSPFLPARAPAVNDRRPAEPITPPYKEGSFSIGDWTGYPDYVPKPDGPFRLLQGEEYKSARKAANRANQKIRSRSRNV
jgi:hypothetical protein